VASPNGVGLRIKSAQTFPIQRFSILQFKCEALMRHSAPATLPEHVHKEFLPEDF
jgi:hypothetical protein